MTVLDVAKDVAPKIGITVPSQLFAATSREMVELRLFIKETADDIATVFDWQLLKTLHTITGDGAATGFTLPSDYDRMLTTASVWSSRYLWEMAHVVDTNRWLELLTLPYTQITGSWTIYGGQFHILDTMANGDTAKFFYLSNLIVSSSGGSNKDAFSADDDSFRLSEKLLALGTVVKWKAQKSQPYDEDLALYNIELAGLMDKDGGSKPTLSGRPPVTWRQPNVAWPGTISGAIP